MYTGRKQGRVQSTRPCRCTLYMAEDAPCTRPLQAGVHDPYVKVIFSLRFWWPVRQRRYARRHSQISQSDPGRPVAVGCVNACSVGNKAATLCRTIIDESFDVFVIVETWHVRSDSTTLLRVIPPGYRCIDAARPIAPDVATDTVDFQNHGDLAFIHRDTVRF